VGVASRFESDRTVAVELDSYNHWSPEESESVRCNSMGSMNRAVAILGAAARLEPEVARVFRSVRVMRIPATHHTDQPALQRDHLQRDHDDWKTGDEPMIDAQRSYLETLCREAGREFDRSISKAEASRRIDELRGRSPRLSDE
jgi:hypothetical protein